MANPLKFSSLGRGGIDTGDEDLMEQIRREIAGYAAQPDNLAGYHPPGTMSPKSAAESPRDQYTRLAQRRLDAGGGKWFDEDLDRDGLAEVFAEYDGQGDAYRGANALKFGPMKATGASSKPQASGRKTQASGFVADKDGLDALEADDRKAGVAGGKAFAPAVEGSTQDLMAILDKVKRRDSGSMTARDWAILEASLGGQETNRIRHAMNFQESVNRTRSNKADDLQLAKISGTDAAAQRAEERASRESDPVKAARIRSAADYWKRRNEREKMRRPRFVPTEG